MKKFIVLLMIAAMATLTGCGDTNGQTQKGVSGLISVVSREDGSGTRGAFVELFGIEEKDAAGNRTDHTTTEAIISNSTEVVLSNVAGNPNAIGYISMGSLNERVKAVNIHHAEPTAANVKDGSYEIYRPFHIATDKAPSEVTRDFIHYMLSMEGQAIVENKGYIRAVESAESFSGNQPSGKVTVAGSSSVAPVMELLIEGYKKVNPNAQIALQTSDSTTGLKDVMDKTADIGMASRALKESESSLIPTVIALDGIAIIVNHANPVESMTKEEVKDIFTGVKTIW